MADNTSDDSPANSPVYTPVAPKFPEQTYRDRSTSPNSDDSEGGPSRPIPRSSNNEPSQSSTEIDPSAGSIGRLYVDPARLTPDPFRPPPPGPPGVNPFINLPVPTQPGTGRRGSRPRTAQGTPPPSRPSTRGSATVTVSNTAQAGDPPQRTAGPSAPRRPSAKRTIKQEDSNSANSTHPTPGAEASATTGPSSDPHPSGKGQSAKRRPNARKPRPNKNPKPKSRRPYVRVADREKVVTGPARSTRGQKERAGRRGRVEFGFGDLDRLERRRREERRAEREG